MTAKDYFNLLRPYQWYKNLVIFIVIIFSGNLFDINFLFLTIIGFISLAMISSVNYILNDFIDIKKDKYHPEKSLRPLASGKVKIWQALVIAAVLFIGSLLLAYQLSDYFLYSILFLFGFTQLYSLFLKNEAFADIIAISINFIVRASIGAFIIGAYISPWLILVIFFLSLFLTLGKRKSDLIYLGENAVNHKQSLKHYSKELIDIMTLISTSAVIITYSLYCILGRNALMIFTLPFVLYALFRYLNLVYSGSKIGRHPHKIFKDLRMIVAGILWFIITAFVIYSGLTFSQILP